MGRARRGKAQQERIFREGSERRGVSRARRPARARLEQVVPHDLRGDGGGGQLVSEAVARHVAPQLGRLQAQGLGRPEVGAVHRDDRVGLRGRRNLWTCDLS